MGKSNRQGLTLLIHLRQAMPTAKSVECWNDELIYNIEHKGRLYTELRAFHAPESDRNYYRYGKKASVVVMELGYPSTKQLGRWVRIYEEKGDQ